MTQAREADIDDPKDAPQDADTLLKRIEATPLVASDGPLEFESRLADEEGWTLGHATAVVAEYRRFLVLTRLRAEPLCAPPDVDLAWRLHAAVATQYTRFWRDALGCAPTRRPSPGDADTPARLRAHYAKTLHAYRAAFGRSPSGRVWPSVEEHVAAAKRLRIASGQPWRVPQALTSRRHALAAAAVVAGLALGALFRVTGAFTTLHGLAMPGFTIGLLAACAAAVWISRIGRPAAARLGARDTLDSFEAAWLAGGARRMAATAIIPLVERGSLLMKPAHDAENGGLVPFIQLAPGVDAQAMRHPVERAIAEAAVDGRVRLAQMRDAIQALGQEVEHRLVVADLAGDRASLQPRRGIALLGATAALALAFSHWLHLLKLGSPALAAAALTIVALLLVAWLARNDRGPTARGEALLERMRLRVRHGRSAAVGKLARDASPTGDPDARALAVALLGPNEAVGDARFEWLEPPPPPPRPPRRRSFDWGRDSTGFSGFSDWGLPDASDFIEAVGDALLD
jgi:uncharacterized protein (TIGR04222 family)